MNSKLISVFLNFGMFICIFGSPLVEEDYGPNTTQPYNHTTPITNHTTPSQTIKCCNDTQIAIIVVTMFALVGIGWLLSCCCRRRKRLTAYDPL